jgi:DNA-binding NtrC family response regulator
MTDEKILLVDDEEEFTRVLAERMKTRGLKVDTAMSGPEALEKAEGESYDAIILDLLMPGMDGIETLERLLKKKPELQVIILTGHATVKKGIDAVKMGAMDFIEKPTDIQKLMEKIKEAKTKKMVLVEKRMEAKIKELIKSKGW